MRTLEVRDHLERESLGEGVEVDRVLSVGRERSLSPVVPSALLPRHFAFFFLSIPGSAAANTAAPLHVLRTNDAAVMGQDGAVVFADTWIDRIHLYFVNYGRPNSPFVRPASGSRTIQCALAQRRLSGEYFLGFNAAYGNYAHWISDEVPALVAYRDHYMESGCRLLLPKVAEGHFVNQTVRMLGIPEHRIERVTEDPIAVDTLYFLSYFNFARIPDYAADAQRVLKAGVTNLPEPRSRRIFVSRPDSHARRLLNEAAVLHALAKLDIQVVAPGMLSLEDQIRTFHAADAVVGPHGAGLVNCGFCEPGSALLELFSEYTTQSHFWVVASASKMRYGFVSGTSIDQDWGLWSEMDNWDAPYVLDPAAVVSGLQTLFGA
jgi:hypothetical protein